MAMAFAAQVLGIVRIVAAGHFECQKAPIQFHSNMLVSFILRFPFKTNIIQNIDLLFLFKSFALSIYPTSKFGIFFPPMRSPSITATRRPYISIQTCSFRLQYPFKTNTIQKISPIFLRARSALITYPHYKQCCTSFYVPQGARTFPSNRFSSSFTMQNQYHSRDQSAFCLSN